MFHRVAWIVLLVGCPKQSDTTTDSSAVATVTIPTIASSASSAPSASGAIAAPLARTTSPGSAVAHVQQVIPQWLKLLARGDDAAFIDEAVVPEELEKVLGGKSKAELVADFRDDKHKGVVKVLEMVQRMDPASITQDGAQTIVTYDPPDAKKITFVVVAGHVYIKN